MNRTEAIATFTAAVARADEARVAAMTAAVTQLARLETETVLTLAEDMRDLVPEVPPLRKLSAREVELIAQSKADFTAGRTFTVEEAFARIDAGLATRRAVRE